MIYMPLLTLLPLIMAAYAAPSSATDRHRVHRTRPLQYLNTKLNVAASDISHIEYTTNWAGAMWNKPAGTFTYVTGTFTVPTPNGSGSASAWVGIDGNGCGSGILQTGVDINIYNGSVSYGVWYEWYPDYSYYFDEFEVSAGDVIKLTVIVFSTTSGETIVQNLTTGKNASRSLTSPDALCCSSAEWIVEDFSSGDTLVQFANFTTVSFTHAFAKDNSSSVITPDGASITDIEQNDQILTSTSVNSSEIIIRYI